MGARRRRHRVDRDDPFVVRLGAGGDGDLPLEPAFQEGEVALHRAAERDPLVLEVIDRIGLEPAGPGIGHGAADIGLGVLGDHGLAAAGDVLCDRRRGVAAPAVEPVQRLAVGGEADRLGGLRILERHLLERLGLDHVARDPVEVGAAVRPRLGGDADVELLVGDEVGVAAGV
jgi:hypothetical protein